MFSIITIAYMGFMGRLSGSGFGAKWNVSWLPEALFSIPFGVALGYGIFTLFDDSLRAAYIVGLLAAVWSYAFMQSATWMFLRWEKHDDPNTERTSTLKPVIDWIAGHFGYKLGDEGYAWIAASVKGFLIGLPVGGIPLAILWPLGYEIGSHAKGRVEKYGLDPHIFSEVLSSMGAGIAIILFVIIVRFLNV
jgi:hypothetical protein